MKVTIDAIGLLGPGLTDWTQAAAMLRGDAAYQQQPIVVPPPARLPPAERRRVGLSVKLALAVADQAFAASRFEAGSTATLFSSSGGDGDNCHLLCEALASDDPQISPTRFTNSVHNAPAGYWSIASGSMAPSSSLCVFDASFGGGLLEAALYALVEQQPIALVAYDMPYPFPLSQRRNIPAAFAMAMVLSPSHVSGGLAKLDIGSWQPGDADAMADTSLEALRAAIPAARCLPLLQAVARARPATLRLGGFAGEQLTVKVSPCN